MIIILAIVFTRLNARIEKCPKQVCLLPPFSVSAQEAGLRPGSTRHPPEVELEVRTLSAGWWSPFFTSLEQARGALEAAILPKSCNSKRGYAPDRQKSTQKGLMISEKSENSVSETSDKTCVNNLFVFLSRIQLWPLEYFQKTLPPTVSNIVTGMVLGHQSSSAVELQHKIKITGMQHVMVASGSNIGLVYYSSLGLLSPFFGLRRACLISLLAIFGYILVIGVEPPVMRAGVMALLTVVSKVLFGRQLRPAWSLGVSGLLLLFIFPEWISSISFQLSMASSLSILMWMPVFQSQSSILTQLDFLNQEFLEKPTGLPLVGKLGAVLLEAFQMTVAAQVLTLPLVLHYFGEVGSLLLIANTLLVPLVPILTLSGFAYLFVGGTATWLSLDLVQQIWSLTVLMPAWLFVDGLTWVSQIPLPVWQVPEFPLAAVGWWWAIVGLAYYGLHILRHRTLITTQQITSSRATK